MSQKREFCGLDYIRLLCFLAAFHPNCTRCCPVGFDGCQCEWAWEDCPQQNGCNSCNGSSSSGLTTESEGGAHAQSVPALDAGLAASTNAIDERTEDARGGTLAFVVTDAGTFGVASIAARDRVRIVRVDANKLDEDPLTVRTTSDITLHVGDAPTRVVADGRGHALVALRHGGAIVTIDPLAGSVVARTQVCATPNGLASDESSDLFHVACASGDVVSVRLSDAVETRRVSLGAPLGDVALVGDGIAASAGARMLSIDPLGAITSRDTYDGAIVLRSTRDGAFVASAPITDIALDADRTAIVSDGEAFLRIGPTGEFVRVGGPGLTRAVALGEVEGEAVARRVLSLQTVSPRMILLFVGDASPMAAAFEPLE